MLLFHEINYLAQDVNKRTKKIRVRAGWHLSSIWLDWIPIYLSISLSSTQKSSYKNGQSFCQSSSNTMSWVLDKASPYHPKRAAQGKDWGKNTKPSYKLQVELVFWVFLCHWEVYFNLEPGKMIRMVQSTKLPKLIVVDI